MSSLPADYLERVYAGVLGKVVGVYLGRPFEGWSYQRIMEELGPIRYYVHNKLDMPLVVTDDDVSGTFVFVRALAEHGVSADLSSEAIGKTWLNNVVENRTVFWWGGNGISTEHTAFRNLKAGIAAPGSGSIETNGKTVAEQIGAQIFIDGWALVAPANPTLAARLAKQAGSVSHDGESVYAAQLWAAMEAEAFVSKDVDHLLDLGLSFIPADSLIASVIRDVRSWVNTDRDWEKTRQRIEDIYGYDKFCGICHVAPNHALMIMALLYAHNDFHKAMYIINTSGWDTDCNSGNLGCLIAIMHGLDGFENGPDWLGPLADRAVVSSADGGYALNNCTRIAYDIANLGRGLAGEEPLPPPKNGAQFHFSLPKSVQGFQASPVDLQPYLIKVEQAIDDENRPGLAIRLDGLTDATPAVEILTQTFTPLELTTATTYDMMASPLIYPGQTVKAVIRADKTNTSSVVARLRYKVYDAKDDLRTVDSPSVTIQPGQEHVLEWMISDDLDSQPIQQLGVALSVPEGYLKGSLWLDSLCWSGAPHLSVKRPSDGPGSIWHRAWINGTDHFLTKGPFDIIHIGQDHGEGILTYGTREWTDYRVAVPRLTVHLGAPAGIAVRVQGLRRYYSLVFLKGGRVALIKARDEDRIELASAPFDWKLDAMYSVSVTVQGNIINGFITGGPSLEATDETYAAGGVGLVTTNGAVSASQFDISPLQ